MRTPTVIPVSISFTINAGFSYLRIVCAAIRGVLLDYNVPTETQHAAELAITEATTNIIKHGYLQRLHEKIEFILTIQNNMLEIIIKDHGQSIPESYFSQADGRVFDFDLNDILSLPEGGMGLSLIKQSVDHVEYRNIDGENWLTLAINYVPNEYAPHTPK